MVIASAHLRCVGAAAVGVALPTAHPLGIASTILMPALALSQPTRANSYSAALAYYGAALWPLIPGAKNFFGPDVSVFASFALWAFAAAALASVWAVVWTAKRSQAIWRSAVAQLLTAIPPLGIIGFASPLTAAGFLFPHTSWCGLLACAVLSGGLAAWPRYSLSALALLALVLNGLYPHDPKPPSSWQGINTNFGAVAHGRVDPMIEYQTAEWIQQYALSASARVVVFPETVVPVWSTATEAFWHQTFDRLRATGKTILVGARVPLTTPRTSPVPYDFTANLAALHGATHAVRLPRLRSSPASESFPYINSVIIRGAQHAEFYQRIPVPIAMWNPLRSASARPHVLGPGVIEVADEKAAILVCYEQLLTWPVLRSATQQPTLLVGMANIHWATGTPIPAFQRTALRAWSRLFGIPAVTAINR